MIWLAGGILFLTGLAIGSFLNVVVFRTIHGYSPWAGRSFCPHCKTKIAWYDNIPLLSFAMLKGRCRKCHRRISWRYPVIELLTANLFLWWYVAGRWVFQLVQEPYRTVQPVFWLGVGVALILLLAFDLFYGILPDVVVGTLGGMTLVYRLSLAVAGIMQWRDLGGYMAAGLGAVGFFWLLVAVTRGKGMGWGDVKLVGALGLVLGWPLILVAVLVAFLTGAMVALILIMIKKKRWGQTIPFGPFLVGGTVGGLVWGEQLWRWYSGILGLPF